MLKTNRSKEEHRVLSQEFRVSQEGEPSSISGYAALFNVASEDLGGWNEIIDPNAFNSVMGKNPDVRALWNHNDDCVLGRTTANTLHLTIDTRGLSYVIDPPDTTLARDLMVSMRRKDITQSSFGFICKRDQWTENADGTVTRRILEFDQLLDCSPVTYPAYVATSVQARNLPSTMPKELRSKISTRGIEDPLDDGLDCGCDCAQCESGNCNLCSDDDCTDEVCSCYNQRSITQSERYKMEMQLALLNLK